MIYADVAYAIDTYGEQYVLTSCDRDADGVADTGALELALVRASALINGYLAGRPALPTSEPVPELLRIYCVDIAIHDLCSTADTLTNEKKERYKQARADLKDIATGKMRLVRDPDAPIPEPVLPLQASMEPERDRTYLAPCVRSFGRHQTKLL